MAKTKGETKAAKLEKVIKSMEAEFFRTIRRANARMAVDKGLQNFDLNFEYQRAKSEAVVQLHLLWYSMRLFDLITVERETELNEALEAIKDAE